MKRVMVSVCGGVTNNRLDLDTNSQSCLNLPSDSEDGDFLVRSPND